jgi:hypothetical protein
MAITAPLTGSVVPKNTPYQIRWNSRGAGPTVKIQASLNGGLTVTTVASAAPNIDGANVYPVNMPNADSSNCYIRITSNTASTLRDTQGPFTVGAP